MPADVDGLQRSEGIDDHLVDELVQIEYSSIGRYLVGVLFDRLDPMKHNKRLRITKLASQKAARKQFRTRRRGMFETLELRFLLSADSIDGRPFIDLGPSDNIAIQQPVVTVQLIRPVDQIVGPNTSPLDIFLLDTGANTILAFQSAVNDMPTYQTNGLFSELGVGGSSLYDISIPYQFDYAGESGVRNTLPAARIISDATRDLSQFGPYGIVGMPAMTERVTTLDFTPVVN